MAFLSSVSVRAWRGKMTELGRGEAGPSWALAALFFYRNTITVKTNKYKFKKIQKIYIVI